MHVDVYRIPESHHVVDLPPAVLTDPAAVAGHVVVVSDVSDVPAAVRRTLIRVFEIEAAHHPGYTVRVRQHEGVDHLHTYTAGFRFVFVFWPVFFFCVSSDISGVRLFFWRFLGM